MSCYSNDKDEGAVFLRVNGQWVAYRGSTSLRKIYYRAYEAKRMNRHKFWVYDYECDIVDGAMFPVDFHSQLSCSSMDGIPSYALPHRILLKKKNCSWKMLGNGCGSICLHCGDQK